MASVSPIVRDGEAARDFYADALGLTFEGGEGDYVFTEHLDGVKHFGLWPPSDAAQACSGSSPWPAGAPIPRPASSSRWGLEDDDDRRRRPACA